MRGIVLRWVRPLRVAVAALSVGLLLAPLAPARASAASRKATTGIRYTYYLATAQGKVINFGGATWYGSASGLHLSAPIVGITTTPDRGGYWLVAADGGVFTYGDATFQGSMSGKLPSGHRAICLVSTPDGGGYWVVDDTGTMYRFGDAARVAPYGLPGADLTYPIVGAAATPDGKGAWLVNSIGQVFTAGDAVSYGSLSGVSIDSKITSIAPTPDGLGYWLVEADGDVFAFGDAEHGATPATGLSGQAIAIAPAGTPSGYWVASDQGSVVPGGSAESYGSTSVSQTGSPIVGIALARVTPTPPNGYPAGAVGFDINWPQCSGSHAGKLPSGPYSIAILGVDGWAVGSDNPCLGAEVSWAKQATEPPGHGTATPPYELYLFLNSPSRGSTIDESGPAGNCASLSGPKKNVCLTYNYGYNAAVGAMGYAADNGAAAKMWWLDIENDACAPGIYNNAANGEFWSCDKALNSETVQGALDALREAGHEAGIYSTAMQYTGITGNYTPTGGRGALGLWVAGAYWTSPPYPSSFGYPPPSVNKPYCAGGKYAFAGGQPVLLQETPGSNGYPYDPDLAC